MAAPSPASAGSGGTGPAPPPAAAAWPAGWTLRLAAATRRPRPGLLLGGSPLHLLRLGRRGVEVLDGLLSGRPLEPAAAAGPEGALARRLCDTGAAIPVPATRQGAPSLGVAVVVPVRDRPAGLAATLTALAATAPDVPVVVVDDASADPDALQAATAASGHRGVRVVRRPARGGPAAAREGGWRAAATDLGAGVVAFVDADCQPRPGWLDVALAHLDDPAVGAVGPRVVASPPRGRPGRRSGDPPVLDRYELARSPLDMGAAPSPVRPGAAVPYVPSAALVVRVAALEAVGGWDTSRRVGEDVDLVWRLGAAGWRVRYAPAATVAHPARATLASMVAQRFAYGTSAAALASAHGAALAPLRAARTAVAAWVAWVVLGAGAGAPAGCVAVARTAWQLRGRTALPWRTCVGIAARGHLAAGRALAHAARRPWGPLVLAAAVAGRPPRGPAMRLALGVVAPLLVGGGRRRSGLGPLRWLALCLADDLAYGAGVWWGVARTGEAGPLVPLLLAA